MLMKAYNYFSEFFNIQIVFIKNYILSLKDMYSLLLSTLSYTYLFDDSTQSKLQSQLQPTE
jgi:hypothetical protein